MRSELWVRKGFGIALVLTIWIAGFGQAVLQLWNLLMPQIFGLPHITFWQAVGLMGLSWLLFGGFRGLGPLGMGGRSRGMSPEQRERFRKGCKVE
jgi:hypothetical protein